MNKPELVKIIEEFIGSSDYYRVWTPSDKLVVVAGGDGSQCAFLVDFLNPGSWEGAARASDDHRFFEPVVDSRPAVEKVIHAMERQRHAGLLIPTGPVTGKKRS